MDESNKKLQLSRGTTRKSNESIKITMAKNNMGVQKFKGHYKQVVSLKKSGCMNNDVMLHASCICHLEGKRRIQYKKKVDFLKFIILWVMQGV